MKTGLTRKIMRKLLCLIAIAVIASFDGSAQTGKEKLPGRPAEQTEIKADQHLEKEIQRKQLSAKPVQLLEAAPASPTKKNVIQPRKKCKSRKSVNPR